MRVVIIDNYDSFVYNIYQMLGELGADAIVIRNDATDVEGLRALSPDAIVISPGPGHPSNERDFGVSAPAIRELSPELPTLGVCLGHQGLAHIYGGAVTSAPTLMHGKSSLVFHDGTGLYEGIPNPFQAGRYHSLIVEGVAHGLEVSARTRTGEIMGLRHRSLPIHGVQFHPESVLTPDGRVLLGNFLRMARR